MREAVGGAFALQIILAFVLLINGYLAYSVNYTRAFRVKNGIIDIIEQSEGYTTNAQSQIASYVQRMNYYVPADYFDETSVFDGLDPSEYTCDRTAGYCVHAINVSGNKNSGNYRGTYYQVVTFVNINIPFLNRFLPLGNYLQVSGETTTIYER